MKTRNYIIMALSVMAAISFASCGDEDSKNGASCKETADCKDSALVCYNSTCIQRCTETSCQKGTVCSAEGFCEKEETGPECSDDKPCADSNKLCKFGRCVIKPECSIDDPCKGEGQKCISGKCLVPPKEPECSNIKPCSDTSKKCDQGMCVNFVEPDVCYTDVECMGDRICDNGKCIAADGCSHTRKCKNARVCRDGKCVDEEKPECSKTVKCADETKTCVAGKCIVCNCNENEFCNSDGSCISKTVSSDGKMTVGATCKYPDDKQKSCDGNRYFDCTQAYGEETHTYKVSNCGTSVCAYTSEDMLGCYEPCTKEGDFIGQCYDEYNSETDSHQGIAFTYMCEKGADGSLYWTYVGAPVYCKNGCVDGNCNFVPEEYGTNCNLESYKDKCQGGWYLFCDSPGAMMAPVVYAENCHASYSEDHYCEVSESGKNVGCVLPCNASENGQQKIICNTIYGGVYSETWKCEKTASGDYAWFMQSYEQCSSKCSETTGKCW